LASSYELFTVYAQLVLYLECVLFLENRLIVFPLGHRNTLSLDCVFGYFDI
jgi:hypothetical protein